MLASPGSSVSRRMVQSLAVRRLSAPTSTVMSVTPLSLTSGVGSQVRSLASAPATKLSNTMTPAEIRTELLAPSFPVEKMTELLDHDNLEMRAEFRKFISEPVMVPRYNISLEEERELALRRLQRICDNKVKPPFRTFFCFTKILFSSSLSLIFGTTH